MLPSFSLETKDKYSKSSCGEGEGETWGRTGGGSCLVSGPQAAIWTGRGGGGGGAPVLFGRVEGLPGAGEVTRD